MTIQTAQQDQNVIYISANDSDVFSRDEALARSQNAVLAKREQFAKEYEIMKAHLKNVGIEKFASEQLVMDKTFKALSIVKNEFGELEQHLDAIEQYFDYYSPRSADDMHSFIAGYVNGAADCGGSVAKRIHKMHDRIHQLLSMPDTLLDTLGRRGGSL